MADRFRGATVTGLVVAAAAYTAAALQAQPSSPAPRASALDRAASTQATPTPRSPQGARGPTITIRTPEAGSTVGASAVTVSVVVKGFRVVNRQFEPPVAGEGHIHFYHDVKKLPRTHSYPSPVHYHSISGTTYTWTGLSPGRHTLAVQLVGNDHVPLRPPVKDRVTVIVRSST